MDAFDNDSSSPPPVPAQANGDAFPEDVDEPEPVMIGAGQDVTSAVLGAADSLEGMNLRGTASSPSVPRSAATAVVADGWNK